MLRRFVPKTQADWDEALSMRARFGTDPRITGPVNAVIDDVRKRGDAAVEEAARKFDQVPFGREKFRLSDVEWDALAAKCPRETVAALELAASRIETFHKAHLPASTRVEHPGAVLEQRVVPLSAVLCYAPGGRASYPSTVLMTAVPARVAGVKRVCVTSPAKGTDDISPAIAAAARIAGAHELWRIGGVQAVAACRRWQALRWARARSRAWTRWWGRATPSSPRRSVCSRARSASTASRARPKC